MLTGPGFSLTPTLDKKVSPAEGTCHFIKMYTITSILIRCLKNGSTGPHAHGIVLKSIHSVIMVMYHISHNTSGPA